MEGNCSHKGVNSTYPPPSPRVEKKLQGALNNDVFFPHHRYIHRFRNAPPSIRQARDHGYFDSGKANEFWWLSPSPPSSSTPKDSTPPEQLQGPSPHPSSSPKLKRNAARRGASPVSPISVSIEYKQSVFMTRVFKSDNIVSVGGKRL